MSKRADHDAILALSARGFTAAEVAGRVGCTSRTVVRARATAGLTRVAPRGNRPITQERLDAARRMFDDGASRMEIMRTLGISRTTLARHFPGRGWTKSEGSAYGLMVRRLNQIDRLAA